MASNQVPSVGRVVHFVEQLPVPYIGYAHRAAIVTQVHGPSESPLSTVELAVFGPNGNTSQSLVEYDPTGQKPGTWHWPEYVAPIEGWPFFLASEV